MWSTETDDGNVTYKIKHKSNKTIEEHFENEKTMTRKMIQTAKSTYCYKKIEETARKPKKFRL